MAPGTLSLQPGPGLVLGSRERGAGTQRGWAGLRGVVVQAWSAHSQWSPGASSEHHPGRPGDWWVEELMVLYLLSLTWQLSGGLLSSLLGILETQTGAHFLGELSHFPPVVE